jgi:hypothetical protein
VSKIIIYYYVILVIIVISSNIGKLLTAKNKYKLGSLKLSPVEPVIFTV